MSDTSARARRFAFAFGSLARNGLIGGRAGVADGAPADVAVCVGCAGGESASDGGSVVGAGLAVAGAWVGGVAGRCAGIEALGVANGGTTFAAVGGVNGRGGGPLKGGRLGTDAAGPPGRGA